MYKNIDREVYKMAKEKKLVEKITPRDEDFAKW